MRIPLSFSALLLFVITASAQSRTIRKSEYEKVFEFAVSKTNEAYPVIFKVTTNFIENGKTIRRITELRENESWGLSFGMTFHRRRRTMACSGCGDTIFSMVFPAA